MYCICPALQGGKKCQQAEFYPSHDADGFGGEEARVAHFIVHYTVKDLLLIVTREWRLKETRAHHFALHYILYLYKICLGLIIQVKY